ncbi:MAG: tRNA-dihydrouridine synthase, partial [Sediminibacterium sp.]|nr:tRNA-dihydrouridine synthase [Sediminibacterium sp.]
LLAPPTLEERVEVCRKHLRKSLEWKGPIAGINEMRRHYANYLKGLPNIKDFRSRLVTLQTMEEVEEVLNEVKVKYEGFTIDRTPIELINYHEKCPV